MGVNRGGARGLAVGALLLLALTSGAALPATAASQGGGGGGDGRRRGYIALGDHAMNYPTEFLQLLKERSGDRCECERSECHRNPGRCRETLSDEPGLSRWSPVMTGDHHTFPPVPTNYIALCGLCAVPRAGARPR